MAIRVGIVGLGRGLTFARLRTAALGLELVALCDTWEERLREVAPRLGVTAYTDYDAFLAHDLDAVVLANWFHEHAPFAVKALAAGKHVLSETAACFTLAQGVELARAAERSGRVYMLAENYAYMRAVQELRRLYQAGEVGTFLYGEGEYVHPMSARELNSISPGLDHWRNWLPATYYCTHSLAPVMAVTDTRPVAVSGFVIPHDPLDENKALTVRRMDTASMIVVRMDNGAIVKLLQYDLRGEGNWVRIHGNRGLMENLRHGDQEAVRVRTEAFDAPGGEAVERVYRPEFPFAEEESRGAGHAGSDYFAYHAFAEAIRRGEQPYLDVHRGVAMSIVGALAWRSALQGSAQLAVPDFRDETQRAAFERDDWAPGPGGAPISVLGEVALRPEGVAYAEEVWRDTGDLLYGHRLGTL
jgi:predicted dehydrogenase